MDPFFTYIVYAGLVAMGTEWVELLMAVALVTAAVGVCGRRLTEPEGGVMQVIMRPRHGYFLHVCGAAGYVRRLVRGQRILRRHHLLYKTEDGYNIID